MAKDCDKNNRWQPCWIVKTILVVVIIGGGLNGWAAFASSEKDNEQDSRIKAVEINQAYVKEQLKEQNAKLDKLIDLSTEINLQVQTHITRHPGP
jgi:predicted negative regulator of RcsB-dependent stress response